MAILLFCTNCKANPKIDVEVCKCGASLKNAPYRVRYRLPSGRWKSQICDNLSLAKQVEAAFRVQSVKEQHLGVVEAATIDQIWHQYFKWALSTKRSWRDDQTRWLLHIKRHITGMRMDQITPRHVEAILSDMRGRTNPKGKPYALATQKQVLVLLRRIYNWAVGHQLYNGSNPASKIETPTFDNEITQPLPQTVLVTLLKYLNAWDNERASLLIRFALFSGRRRGEILKMKWDHVDLVNGLVTFPGANTKNRKTQIIPMNQNCLAILQRCHQLKMSHWVFPSSTGAYYTTFENTWKTLKKNLKLPYRFHDLRHTFGSYLASNGVDIFTLKNLLGHKEIKMTQRYAHLANHALKRGSNVADTVFDFSGPK